MLKVEQGESGSGSVPESSSTEGSLPMTYGDYLRVPEVLALQTPLSNPLVHDEMLFIILQQIQELWFKQILFELKSIIECLDGGRILEAVSLLHRVNRIIKAVGAEVEIMEMLPPQEFVRFRHVLTSSSGFESEQFRELELASGLNDRTFLTLMAKHMNMAALQARWPRTLHDAFLGLLAKVDSDPAEVVARIYSDSAGNPELYMLAEALSEYEVLFGEWRFHHVKLVERTIGDRSPGTAGSSGVGYLGKTLGYRFFPELWEARNRISAGGPAG
jgi:tryptophan 2,3-dioxygenase